MEKSNIKSVIENAKALAQEIIDEFGPRLTGMQSCLNAADRIEEELKKYCGSTAKQDFKVHPLSFLGWIRLLVVFYIAGTILLWLELPYISAALLGLGILVMVLQFFLYKAFIDIFYPSKTGRNVTGTIEPEGEAKQHIIISGHHDSARVFNFFIHQPWLYSLRVTGSIAILGFIFVCSAVLSFLPGIEWLSVTISSLASLGLVLVIQLWFFASKKGTPGAGDNLLATTLGVMTMREFSELKKQGNGLKHTRVSVISFDSEEAGLRGAKAYAIEHEREFKSIPTYVYNIDCPYYLKDMFFLTSDINTSVKLSEEMAEECAEIANKLGYPAKAKPITFLTGGTDAGELAKRGAHATTLMAMPWDNTERASVYHTPDDTVDKAETQALEAALHVFIEYVRIKDEQVRNNHTI